ncbi:MAG: hypothetical protein RIC55_29725 [Pirellulaceae bacterium]
MNVQIVSDFESRLLRITQGFLGGAPWEQVRPLLSEKVERPIGFAAAAGRLLQDTLAKGCVRYLAEGGWRNERFLRGEAIVEGRLWRRRPASELALTFSRNTLDFLVWCTATRLQGANARWTPRRGAPLTLGDRLLFFLAYRAARHSTAGDVLRRQPSLAEHGLCRLAFPEDFAGVGEPVDLDAWVAPPACVVLESLQDELATTWMQLEQRKPLVGSPAVMGGISDSQDIAFSALIAAADGAGRRDLARFVLDVGHRLLRKPRRVEEWTGALQLDAMRLAARRDVQRAALVVPRAILQLEQWQREAVGVGYTDEGYNAAQLWKSDWERFEGDAVCRNARALLRPFQ